MDGPWGSNLVPTTSPLSSVCIDGYRAHFIQIKISGFYQKPEDHPSRKPVVGILAEEWSDHCFIQM